MRRLGMDTRELIFGDANSPFLWWKTKLTHSQASDIVTQPLLIFAVTISCAGKDAATLVRTTR
jgi:hypothetical protein